MGRIHAQDGKIEPATSAVTDYQSGSTHDNVLCHSKPWWMLNAINSANSIPVINEIAKAKPRTDKEGTALINGLQYFRIFLAHDLRK